MTDADARGTWLRERFPTDLGLDHHWSWLMESDSHPPMNQCLVAEIAAKLAAGAEGDCTTFYGEAWAQRHLYAGALRAHVHVRVTHGPMYLRAQVIGPIGSPPTQRSKQ